MKNLAREHFHRPPEHLNCAQAVLRAYQQWTGDHALSVPAFKSFGGGRAPEGLCGALHAACAIAPTRATALRQHFAEVTGSLFCKELKGTHRISCENCVSTAADILERELGMNGPKNLKSEEPLT